jgi:carbonic anhydrase
MLPPEQPSLPAAPPVIQIESAAAIPDSLRGTPIDTLLRVHNFGETFPGRSVAEMLIVTCMDFRIDLSMPKNHAFIIRTAGAKVDPVRFNLDFAMAVVGLNTVAIIGHTDCAMTRTHAARDQFIGVLPGQTGCTPDEARANFEHGHSTFGIHDCEIRAAVRQVNRVRRDFPTALVVPLLYDVTTHRLGVIDSAFAAAG